MNIKNGLNRKTKENKKLNDCRQLDKTGTVFREDTGNDEVQVLRKEVDFNKEYLFFRVVITIIISNTYFPINLVFSGYFCPLRLLWYFNASSLGKIIYAVAERLFQQVQAIGQV